VHNNNPSWNLGGRPTLRVQAHGSESTQLYLPSHIEVGPPTNRGALTCMIDWVRLNTDGMSKRHGGLFRDNVK
jgi:hypothetical protein